MNAWSASRKKIVTATVVGLVVTLIALGMHWSSLLHVLELKALDHRFARYAHTASPTSNMALVAIDESSLETIGRWPWARDLQGLMVRYLKAAGARAIVFDVLFLESDNDNPEFEQVFAKDMQAAGQVFLPLMLHEPIVPQTIPSAVSPVPEEIFAKASVTLAGLPPPPSQVRHYRHLKPPVPLFATAAHRLGFINLFPDPDGVWRQTPLLAFVQGRPVPQLALAVAQDLLGVSHMTFSADSLRLGPITIPLTAQTALMFAWRGRLEQQSYPSYSASAVIESALALEADHPPLLPPALFTDKIVFIGATAAGTYDLVVTPLGPATPGVHSHMTLLDSILQQRFLRPAPYWLLVVTMLVLCLSTAWSFMLLSHQGIKFTFILALAIGYYGLTVYAFVTPGWWVELALPEGALALTYAVAATMEYLLEGKQRRQVRLAFDRFMSREVVDQIMQQAETIKLGGEMRQISVFFSDVAGFTTISEHLEPEALVEMLNTYLTAMTDAILQQRGNVNKYLGDGIMALFGAPAGEPHHATLACYAALDCQRVLAEAQPAWQARGYPPLTTRIGINSGPLVVGNMGSEKRMEYTVMGDNVNLASRLEGANKFYDTGILLGPLTYELARHDIEAREVDRLRVKGKHEPVVVYELLGRRGSLSPQRQQLMKAFGVGLEAYKARDFLTAQRCFTEALAVDPADGPSQVYLARTTEYLDTPPPLDWDGVYELTSK